ncbi:MAG: ribosome-associated translation inhibitor RaiA [Candidatus Marinimicrobia bacterium]|nr:ribosome-associated translation inhibitor RaiA [Candidatus Neomarinimicrobiota bacterium]
MKIELTARHYEASDRVKRYVDAEVNKLEKIHSKIVNCRVILNRSKEGEMAEINLHISGKDFVISETSGDIIKSIDLAVTKMERQLKRFKGKRYSNARVINSRENLQG